MKRKSWEWSLQDIKQDKDVKVFSTFSCGGGSSMGYKKAGFDVIGNVEIDPRMNELYLANNHPKYNFCEDLREFNRRDNLPDELFHLDILDGSPPCTSFSLAGKREETWSKEKQFREGQTKQCLDDLFFVFLDTVEKLRPRIVVSENVKGMLTRKARGYVNLIIKRFQELGYDVQIFLLNSAHMNVPQARQRVFFIANRCNFPKLHLDFAMPEIKFKDVRTKEGKPISKQQAKKLLSIATERDADLSDVVKRLGAKKESFFGYNIIHDENVCCTLTSAGSFYRFADKTAFSDEDYRRVQSFPVDYDFKAENVQYVCGMSVPPNMMQNIAQEIWEQWLS